MLVTKEEMRAGMLFLKNSGMTAAEMVEAFKAAAPKAPTQEQIDQTMVLIQLFLDGQEDEAVDKILQLGEEETLSELREAQIRASNALVESRAEEECPLCQKKRVG